MKRFKMLLKVMVASVAIVAITIATVAIITRAGVTVAQAAPEADLPVYVPDIVLQPDDPQKSAEVVESHAARDGTTLELTLKPAMGDFAVDFDFEGTHLKRLRLVLLDTPSPRRLEYVFTTARGDNSVTMLDAAGVVTAQFGKNCTIDFGPKALAKLAPTGRLRVWTSDAAAEAARLSPLEKTEAKPAASKPAESKPVKGKSKV